MKITLTTTEGIKEFENIETLAQDHTIGDRMHYVLSPFLPAPTITVDSTKVLLIHVTKEGEN